MERVLEDGEFDQIQLREEYDSILLRESLLMRMLEDNPQINDD